MATLDLENNIRNKDHDQSVNDTRSNDKPSATNAAKDSAYKSLGWLDRLLALWILLVIIIGILIGN